MFDREHREPIRLLIADSTRMGSELLAGALRRETRIVGCAADWNGIVRLLPKRPEVTIIAIDFEQPSGGLQATRRLIEEEPGARVVMLLDDDSDHNLVVEAFRAGVRGVFSRAQSSSTVGRCIRSVQKGQVWATSEQLGYKDRSYARSAHFAVG
jgi:DNA-binding NarL/FixJ family response regulator